MTVPRVPHAAASLRPLLLFGGVTLALWGCDPGSTSRRGGTADSQPSNTAVVPQSSDEAESAPAEGAASAESAATDTEPATWTLAETPEFSVAESMEEPAFQVFRALHGLILDDGSMVIGNAGSGNLIYLDPTGRALKVVGGFGGGPGEFGGISGLFPAGDELGVWDLRMRRVSFFSVGGVYVGGISLSGDQVVPRGFLPGEGVVTTP